MSQALQYEDATVATFIANQEKLLDRFNIPKGLNEIGVPEDCVDRIAKNLWLIQHLEPIQ
jgi:alcohol dehydrogenase class IV